ncbi:MAG TPA: glycosyltransferase family 4 protein [Polyangia bacterium]
MNVLFALDTRLAKHGSFEDLLLALSAEIARRGGKSTFVFPGIGVPELGRALAVHSQVHVLERPWRSPRIGVELLRLVARERPDVLNTHFCDGLRFLPLYLGARARGVRVFFHYHGEIRPLDEVHPIKRHLSALRLQTLPVHRILTVSQANARFLRHLAVRPPIDVVYNGIDLSRFAPGGSSRAAIERYGLNRDWRYLCYIGSLIPRKRPERLLKSFAAVLSREPELRLVLVGGGDIERYRLQARALGIEERVIFTGLTQEYPIDLLRHAEVLVSASAQESFGLLFAEAFALGVPVVACRVGGVPEVVGDGEVGLLADPHDLEDFTDKILRLTRDEPLRRKLSARARLWVERRFSLQAEVEKLLDCFASGHKSATVVSPSAAAS